MQAQEQVKKSFYVQKPDPKYKLLQNPIGVDVDTKRFTTRTITASGGSNTSTLGGIETVQGKKIDFDITVSPGTIIDWNNSCMDSDFYISNVSGSAATSSTDNLIAWNQYLDVFSEVHLQMNGTNILDKVGGDYLPTQTIKWFYEKDHEEIESSQAVFGPIYDEYYSSSVASPTYLLQPNVVVTATAAGAISVNSGATMSHIRNENYITGTYTHIIKKSPTFKDLFFSFPGYSKNLRNIKISLVIKSTADLALGQHASGTAGYLLPKEFKIQLKEVQPSPNSSIGNLNDALSKSDEHLAFIDVENRLLTYSSNMVVNNQNNVQFIAVSQFGKDFTNTIGTTSASLLNCGQLQLFNGYSSATPAAGTVLYRSDVGASTACQSPPSSIQVQYGSDMYPANAIELRREGITSSLEMDELYREFRRSVVNPDKPSIREYEFKRTLPLFMVKTHPNPKLQQASDIVVRMPGFSAGSNVGTQYVRILWGKLKSFNIAASGVVSEAISTF